MNVYLAWKVNSKEKPALNFSRTMEEIEVVTFKDVRVLNKKVLYFVPNPTKLPRTK